MRCTAMAGSCLRPLESNLSLRASLPLLLLLVLTSLVFLSLLFDIFFFLPASSPSFVSPLLFVFVVANNFTEAAKSNALVRCCKDLGIGYVNFVLFNFFFLYFFFFSGF